MVMGSKNVTDSHRNYYVFYFITLRHSHPQKSSSGNFFFCWYIASSSVEFQRYIFLDHQRGYVTVYWSRIRVLSSPSEGRPLAAVIINDCWIPWFISSELGATFSNSDLIGGFHSKEFSDQHSQISTLRSALLEHHSQISTRRPALSNH